MPSAGYYSLDDESHVIERLEYYSEIGIDALAVYTYWFSPQLQALNTPLKIMSECSQLPLDFFIAWVNADWTKSWIGADEEVIAKQKYGYTREMYLGWRSVLEHKNYLKVSGRHVLYVHNPTAPDFDFAQFKEDLTQLMHEDGLPTPYIISPFAHSDHTSRKLTDLSIGYPPGDVPLFPSLISILNKVQACLPGRTFTKVVPYFLYWLLWFAGTLFMMSRHRAYAATYLTGWDNTPRYGRRGYVLGAMRKGIAVQAWCLKVFERKSKIIFVKAANEWAEGNTVEEEVRGNPYADVIKKAK